LLAGHGWELALAAPGLQTKHETAAFSPALSVVAQGKVLLNHDFERDPMYGLIMDLSRYHGGMGASEHVGE
jgi:hypothetical protein